MSLCLHLWLCACLRAFQAASESNSGVAAEAPGVGKILEKDLIEPGQIRHSLGVPSAPFWEGGGVISFGFKISSNNFHISNRGEGAF